jgi:hypothetical protein
MIKAGSLKATMKMLDSWDSFPIETSIYKLAKNSLLETFDLMLLFIVLHVGGGA